VGAALLGVKSDKGLRASILDVLQVPEAGRGLWAMQASFGAGQVVRF